MSNGVEVIIAGEKNAKASTKSNILRIIPSLSRKPMTLAPSTLNDQMTLIMPLNAQETYTKPIVSKQFITKTCLTTYTYRTTYIKDEKTSIETSEKVISNTATEERNYLNIKPTETLEITASRNPEVAAGVFHTTYTHFTTKRNRPDDYILFLQSSEATSVLDTNTYNSKISLTKTLNESDLKNIHHTSNILTEVFVTESLQTFQGSSTVSSIDEDQDKYSQLFQTYSYYFVDKNNENLTPTVQNVKIPGVENNEIFSSSSTSLVMELQGSIQTDLHIYSTKTYLTTFTYFTTLINTNNEGSIDLSTVVNFHTRVIENVITESIPSLKINTDLLSAFETQLKNPFNKNSFVTIVTLTGGQSLQLTAMNILHPSLSQRNQITKTNTNNNANTKLSSKLAYTSLPYENSSEIFDSVVQSTENEELFDDEYFEASEVETSKIIPNSTMAALKTTVLTPVNKIIGSFDLNRLQALGPVFNVMAGLIQSNLNSFSSNANNKSSTKKNATIENLQEKELKKNISTMYNGSSSSFTEKPIYIPVNYFPNDNRPLERIKNSSHMQGPYVNFPESQSWIFNNKLNQVKLEKGLSQNSYIGKPKYETSLLNGGIPISPGEVITANSDVIVGKPNGIQPRVTLPSKMLSQTIPLMKPNSFHYQHQNVEVGPSPNTIPLSDPSFYFDGILKPPPPNVNSSTHSNSKSQYTSNRMRYPAQHHTQHLKYFNTPQIPQNNKNRWLHSFPHPHSMSVNIPSVEYDQIYLPRRDKNNDRRTANLSNINQNEVLEIKRAPQVYSENLPAFKSVSPNKMSQYTDSTGIYKTYVKKIISPNKSMLIDIQPSKFTSVVIPNDNFTSIFVVESSMEMQKNGKYYDEPTSYSDALMTGSANLASSSNQRRKPILSNQQINLDLNVLSHNVDINVPPITFKKDFEFPHSTPVRGHIQNREPLRAFKMPHVTLPLNDNQIQVNLTSHNTITQNLPPTQFSPGVNDRFRNNSFIFENNKKIIDGKSTTKVPTFYNYIEGEQQPLRHEHLRPLESSYFHYINMFKNKSEQNNFENIDKKYHFSPNVIPLKSNTLWSHLSEKPTNQKLEQNRTSNQRYQHTTSTDENLVFRPLNSNVNVSFENGLHGSLNYNKINMLNKYYSSNKLPISDVHHLSTKDNNDKDQQTSSSFNAAVPLKKPNIALGIEHENNNLTVSKIDIKKKIPPNTTLPPTTNNFLPEQPSISSIYQINDLSHLKLPEASVQNLSTLSRHPSLGKPFTQLTNNSNKKLPSSNNTTTITREVLNNGEGFKLKAVLDQHEFDPTPHSLVLEAVDSQQNQNKHKTINNFHQTEAPFELKYTGKTKKPQTIQKLNDSELATEQINYQPKQTESAEMSFNTDTSFIAESTNTYKNSKITKNRKPALKNSETRFSDHPSQPIRLQPTIPVIRPIVPSISAVNTKSVSSIHLTRNSKYSLSNSNSVDTTVIISNPTMLHAGLTTSPIITSVVSSYSTLNPSKSSSISTENEKNHRVPNEINGLSERYQTQNHLMNSIPIENKMKTKLPSPLIGKEESLLSQSKKIMTTETELNSESKATSLSNSIITTTKYITKQQYFTITTTKLRTHTSLGVPATRIHTIKLIETMTSKVIDTVTKIIIQPTRVTEILSTTETLIKPYEDYRQNQYRLGNKIEPTIEVVNNVILKSDDFDKSEIRSPAIPVIESISPFMSFGTRSNQIQTVANTNVASDDHNNIFVVMTDKNSQGGILSISPTNVDASQIMIPINVGGEPTEEAAFNTNSNSIDLDYDYNITFDYLPTRDEEAESNEVNHVLLGGVLIATPPRISNSGYNASSAVCKPSCRSPRNEICQKVDQNMQCICRPGFARMFPDRPCRPTYTYTLEIPLHRISSQILNPDHIRDSEYFKLLRDITHNAVDRMVMQSDLRDVYHGVHVTSFELDNSRENDGGILGKFLIQLSDNSDEKRISDVFKKYLRQNNYNLGGTDIFTTKDGAKLLRVNDFDECSQSEFNDCSENSGCFNLQGTYTCSCKEGYADLSENSIYPGRICSTEAIGCAKCHFHGKCVLTKLKNSQSKHMVCECFPWFSGANCQLNLKIVLIVLITIGTFLFLLLLFCVLVTTRSKGNRHVPTLTSGMQFIASKNTRFLAKKLSMDKLAMIKDSGSEGSRNSPSFVHKMDVDKQSKTIKNAHRTQMPRHYQNQNKKSVDEINQRRSPSTLLVSSFCQIEHQQHNFSEQNDRSLRVMIPRAKYHHSVLGETINSPLEVLQINCREAQSKYIPSDTLCYSSNASTIQCSNEKLINSTLVKKNPITTTNSNNNVNHGLLTKSTGALVSAGFEVSTTVGNVVTHQQQQLNDFETDILLHSKRASSHTMDSASDQNVYKFSNGDAQSQYNIHKSSDKLSEARSFNEATVNASSRLLCCPYEKQLSQSNGNDEANTMAERDIGSTCLLPHSHLYKSDMDSDVSGFDSF